MLLNALGVHEDVFKLALDNALKNLQIDTVVFNLYQSAMKLFTKKAGSTETELIRDMNMFFGPSKIFIPIFKHALIKITAYEKQYLNDKERPYEYLFRIE